MDDAELVRAAQAGDSFAFGAIYDRYADRIHDFATITLRDPAEAAEVTQQTFLVAFEWLEELSDPARLQPWLFAIAHRAGLQQAGRRTRPAVESNLVVPSAARDEQPPSRAELADFARQQAGRLDDADLALLDLHLRQGLDGEDLADAVGVTTSRVHVMLNQLRTQLERSLGALIVARTNRRECAQLAQLLTASGGRLTPALAEEITRHVDDCETCNSRRRMVLPMALLAATPLTPAPAALRHNVLSQAHAGSGAAGWVFDADGFPNQGSNRHVESPLTTARRPPRLRARHEPPTVASSPPMAWSAPPPPDRPATTPVIADTPPPSPLWPPGPPGPPWRNTRVLAVAALAAVIVLIAGITFALASGRGHTPKVTVAATRPTSGVTPAPSNPPDTTTPTTSWSTSTSLGAGTTSLPTSTIAQPGHFNVGATKLDFGTTVLSLPLVVSNDGAGGLTFSATSPAAQLTISPANGAIDPGTSKTLTVSVDRTSAPPGPFSTTVSINSSTGTAIVAIAAIIDPGPVISGELASPAEIKSKDCPVSLVLTTTTANITASVSGPVMIGSGQVILHWQSTAGTGTKAMTFNGSAATANLGPFPTTGSVDWWITGADTAGVTGTSAHHQVAVSCRLT